MNTRVDEYFGLRPGSERRVHAFMVSLPNVEKCAGVITFSHQPMDGGSPIQSEHFVIPSEQLLRSLHEEIGKLLESNKALRPPPR
ncbi:MAG: hypothetical protein KBO60_18270 [Achromobacter sp.]|nr:hypothetical protein [Achromobacter sp.]